MKNYLAKSDGETIIQHTNNLLNSEKVLLSYYPNIAKIVSPYQLSLAAKFHDTGKINTKFQQKMLDNMQGEQVYWEEDELPHALFSACYVSPDLFFTDDEYKATAAAVLYHHGLRRFDSVEYLNLTKQIQSIKIDPEFWRALGLSTPVPEVPALSLTHLPSPTESWYRNYLLLVGLLHRLDYASSGHYPIEIANGKIFINVYHKMKAKGYKLNDMQNYLMHHTNNSIVLRGQTGLGKTEGALMWIKNDKAFFTLPLRSAINSIYYRVKTQYTNNDLDVGILHSTSILFLNKNNMDMQNQILAKKLSMPLSITTPDQVFRFMFRYPGSSQYLATLAYSKVVVDEIQQYSPETLGYLLYGLDKVQEYGGKFLVMSATIYPFVTSLMEDLGIECQTPKPFIDKEHDSRHYVKTYHQFLKASNIEDIYKGKKTLVIVNTAKRARELYLELLDKGLPVHLFTSQFINQDRMKLEKQIEHAGAQDIWISTQVAEASLDIDFDCGIFELADLASVYQRMGRVYRKRNFRPNQNNKYNIHLFLGPDKAPLSAQASGVGYIYDPEIFKQSRQALMFVKGRLTEENKNSLLEEYFSIDKVKSMGYYKKVAEAIQFCKNVSSAEFDKKEALRLFRKIESIDCIPAPVYKKYKKEIDTAAQYINSGTRKEKMLYRISLNRYLVSLYPSKVKGNDKIKLTTGEVYPIADVLYDSEIGVH